MTAEELSERLLNFAAKIVEVTDALPDTRSGKHIAGQLLRCGTSPAPNYEEACAAESRRDFIHKLGITLKELRESRLWLKLISKCKLLPDNVTTPTLAEANELCNIIGKSVVTAKQPPAKKKNDGNEERH